MEATVKVRALDNMTHFAHGAECQDRSTTISNCLSRDQTYRRKIYPFRSFYERGLEHFPRHLYEDRNFLGGAHRKLTATLTIRTNPPFYDDDNKLNFHLLTIQVVCTGWKMAKLHSYQVCRISSVIVID